MQRYFVNEKDNDLVSINTGTIEEFYDPYLIKNGFINRTPRGRTLTKLAYEHMGVKYEG